MLWWEIALLLWLRTFFSRFPFTFLCSSPPHLRLHPSPLSHKWRIGAPGFWWRNVGEGVGVLISIYINLINLNLMTQYACTVGICLPIRIWGIVLNRLSELALIHFLTGKLACELKTTICSVIVPNMHNRRPPFFFFFFTCVGSKKLVEESTEITNQDAWNETGLKEKEKLKLGGKNPIGREVEPHLVSLFLHLLLLSLLSGCLCWWIAPSVTNN